MNKVQNQISDISKDFKLTDNELKKYEDKCKILLYEKDSLSLRVEEFNKELRNKIENISNISSEKDEYSQKLRIISEEYDKLLRAYDYLNLDFKKLSASSHTTENINENLKKQTEGYLRRIKELEEELRNSIRLAEMADFKRLEAEKTSETLIKDMHSAKAYQENLIILVMIYKEN